MICPACDHDNIAGVDQCADCGTDLAGLEAPMWDLDPNDALLARPLEQLPLKPALVVRSGSSVADAIELMCERREGCVFVVDPRDRLVGVLTERDVSTRVVVRGRDPRSLPIDQVMTREPVTMRRDDPLAWALHRMGVDGHRHLPVVDGGRLLGFVSARRVLGAFLDAPAGGVTGRGAAE
ncbi:MAG TPA: CBS domain-containing protein [Candidatus Polarisedimenticolaceae bacterium]|nr:CBS domain-containing protein [Candidatus Polarisedimenticolaceae bacterium]